MFHSEMLIASCEDGITRALSSTPHAACVLPLQVRILVLLYKNGVEEKVWTGVALEDILFSLVPPPHPHRSGPQAARACLLLS